jgi:hypothetical protein
MPIEKQPDSEHRWDHTQRKLVPHPPLILVDRLEDFLHYPGVRGVLAQLSPQGVQAIKDAVIYLLGQFRQRHEHSEDHL